MTTSFFLNFTKSLKEFLAAIIRPSSKFYPGDHVQSFVGGPLMIVQWAKYCRITKSFIITCAWFDAEGKTGRVDNFREEDLRSFNWYEAY